MGDPTFEVVSFLSDFGRTDIFVGVCHGVLLTRAPHVTIIDVTHDVAPGDVVQGALLLERAVPHLPRGVHLAVVDPGVGTSRRAVAVTSRRGDVFVGPDNGLLLPAAESLGGIEHIREIGERAPSGGATTFDGRDVFAPAAARVASGVAPAELGPAVADPTRLSQPVPDIAAGQVRADVTLVDRFGNIQLNARPRDLAEAALSGEVEIDCHARTHRARQVDNFAALTSGELGWLADSDGYIALVLPGASAAVALGLEPRDRVTLRRG